MIGNLDTKLLGSTSAIQKFIERVKSYEKLVNPPTKSSTNKMVYEYFLKIMIEVRKSFGLLASCYILKEYHTNGKN